MQNKEQQPTIKLCACYVERKGGTVCVVVVVAKKEDRNGMPPLAFFGFGYGFLGAVGLD